jgi:multiple sugar transport system substrate-binding protein
MLPIWQTSFQGDAVNTLMSYGDTPKVMVPAFSAQFPFAVVRPKVAYYVEGSKALQLAMQNALTHQKDPKAALDEAAAKWTDLGK